MGVLYLLCHWIDNPILEWEWGEFWDVNRRNAFGDKTGLDTGVKSQSASVRALVALLCLSVIHRLQILHESPYTGCSQPYETIVPKQPYDTI